MNLSEHYPANPIPSQPFIGLFGNHQNNWRDWCRHRLSSLGIDTSQIYDSTDAGWSIVNDYTGDELQLWVNELVARQHKAMRQAECLIFSLDGEQRDWDLESDIAKPDPRSDAQYTLFAARCEIGWLAGIGKPTFVWIPNTLEGRNYLHAVVALYPSVMTCVDLSQACEFAAKSMLKKS